MNILQFQYITYIVIVTLNRCANLYVSFVFITFLMEMPIHNSIPIKKLTYICRYVNDENCLHQLSNIKRFFICRKKYFLFTIKKLEIPNFWLLRKNGLARHLPAKPAHFSQIKNKKSQKNFFYYLGNCPAKMRPKLWKSHIVTVMFYSGKKKIP